LTGDNWPWATGCDRANETDHVTERIHAMNDNSNSRAQTDEDILNYEFSDEALEAASGTLAGGPRNTYESMRPLLCTAPTNPCC
jgi:hypothetical protein